VHFGRVGPQSVQIANFIVNSELKLCHHASSKIDQVEEEDRTGTSILEEGYRKEEGQSSL